jgi:hypothetical protein
MDADTYAQAVQYEQLTQIIYKELLALEGDLATEVAHNQAVKGKSGVEHQIDVLFRFKKAGVEHATLIECKHYATALTLEKVRNFFAVLHDIGNCRGIMVTKTGYQSGVIEFANFYGIDLKLLRKPIEEDWEGRVKTIQVNLIAKQLVSTAEKPVIANFEIGAADQNQIERIASLKAKNRFSVPNAASIEMYSQSREVYEETFGWWLPRQLQILEKQPGGPYQEKIFPKNRWLLINPGDSDEELIPIISIDVTYFVEQYDPTEIVVDGAEIVQAVLRDFNTGEIEHFKRFDK